MPRVIYIRPTVAVKRKYVPANPKQEQPGHLLFAYASNVIGSLALIAT
jgi:hypothetical protein